MNDLCQNQTAESGMAECFALAPMRRVIGKYVDAGVLQPAGLPAKSLRLSASDAPGCGHIKAADPGGIAESKSRGVQCRHGQGVCGIFGNMPRQGLRPLRGRGLIYRSIRGCRCAQPRLIA
jgi:hypothetical protein